MSVASAAAVVGLVGLSADAQSAAAPAAPTTVVVASFPSCAGCSVPEGVEPPEMTLVIGQRAEDLIAQMSDLNWSHWGRRRTTGRGQASINLGDGARKARVTIRLDRLMWHVVDGCGPGAIGRIYRRATIRVRGASAFDGLYRVKLPPTGCETY